MSIERITYDRFMKEVYPILAGTFDQYSYKIHSDLSPLWSEYKQTTLGFHESLILSSWKDISLNSVFEPNEYGLVHSVTGRIKVVGEKLTSYSSSHQGYLREFDSKIVSNYMLFQHDPELKMILEGFILAKRNHVVNFLIPQKLRALGVQGKLLCEWRYGRRGLSTEVSQVTIANFQTNSLTNTEFYLPTLNEIEKVLSYLRKASSLNQSTPVHSQAPIQELHQQRAILLRTLQTIG